MAQQHFSEDSRSQTDTVAPDTADTQNTTPKSLSADRLEALLLMQKMDPFCKAFQSGCPIEKHQSTRQISSYM